MTIFVPDYLDYSEYDYYGSGAEEDINCNERNLPNKTIEADACCNGRSFIFMDQIFEVKANQRMKVVENYI